MYHFFFREKSVCPKICEVTFVENPQKSASSRFTEDSARSKLYAFSLFLSCYFKESVSRVLYSFCFYKREFFRDGCQIIKSKDKIAKYLREMGGFREMGG